MRSLLARYVALLVLGVCSPAVLAQDATIADSAHYHVALENDAVRVLRVTYGPGERSVMHAHPEGLLVFLTDGEGTFTYPDGTADTFQWSAGQTEWVPAMTHLPENTGDEGYELLFIEIKRPPASQE